MNTLNERLAEYLQQKKITDPEVYKRIGVKQSVFAGWIKQGRAIPLNKVQMILTMFQDLPARWLMTGENEQKPVYPENSAIHYVEDREGIICPFCLLKDKLIDSLQADKEELKRDKDDLRRQIERLEFSLGKNQMKA